jgi:tetratricopeptide (TPR) repeat protein
MADDLDARQQRVMAVLSAVGAPMSLRQIANLQELEQATALSVLGFLVNRMLVLTNADDSQFWLPPHAGQFVARALTEVVMEQSSRLREYVLSLFSTHGHERYGGFGALDDDWLVIKGAVPLMQALPSAQLQSFCESSRYYLSFSGHWDERLQLASGGEAKAAAEGDLRSAFRRAYDVGMVYYRRGEWDAVGEASLRVKEHASRMDDPQEGIALGLRLASLGLRGKGALQEAITAGEESVRIFGLLGRTKDYACALNALGVTLRLAGDAARSKQLSGEALVVAREVGNREYEADYTGNLADLPLDRGDWDAARVQAQEALELSSEIGRIELVARNHFRLSRIEYGARNSAKAAAHGASAFQLYTQLGMPQAEDVARFLESMT